MRNDPNYRGDPTCSCRGSGFRSAIVPAKTAAGRWESPFRLVTQIEDCPCLTLGRRKPNSCVRLPPAPIVPDPE